MLAQRRPARLASRAVGKRAGSRPWSRERARPAPAARSGVLRYLTIVRRRRANPRSPGDTNCSAAGSRSSSENPLPRRFWGRPRGIARTKKYSAVALNDARRPCGNSFTVTAATTRIHVAAGRTAARPAAQRRCGVRFAASGAADAPPPRCKNDGNAVAPGRSGRRTAGRAAGRLRTPFRADGRSCRRSTAPANRSRLGATRIGFRSNGGESCAPPAARRAPHCRTTAWPKVATARRRCGPSPLPANAPQQRRLPGTVSAIVGRFRRRSARR